jgi:hypothetical protein
MFLSTLVDTLSRGIMTSSLVEKVDRSENGIDAVVAFLEIDLISREFCFKKNKRSENGIHDLVAFAETDLNTICTQI